MSMYGEKRILWANGTSLGIEFKGWTLKASDRHLTEDHFMELLEEDIVKKVMFHHLSEQVHRSYRPHPKERKLGEDRVLYFNIGKGFNKTEIGNIKIIVHEKQPWFKDRYHWLKIVFKIFLNQNNTAIRLPDASQFQRLWNSHVHKKFGGIFS
ncbi:hypothetical protein H6503_05870 [Candidatus Woesearchaeota archaeon]|nr:hypothetical protein [Candidatus Woesearchaeota archaeon]